GLAEAVHDRPSSHPAGRFPEARKRHELASRARSGRLLEGPAPRAELGIELLAHASELALVDRAAHGVRIDAVDARRVQTQNLALELGRELRVAVLLLQLGRDLQRAERLDLRLRRAEPEALR